MAHKLPRDPQIAIFNMRVREAHTAGQVCIDISRTDGSNHLPYKEVNICLNGQEIDDLIVLLQYYRTKERG